MNSREEEFLKRLEATFRIEADEHIRGLTAGLIELEKKPETKRSQELVETIFRSAHSFKGAARSVGRTDIETICQALESVLAKSKNEKTTLTAAQFDLVYETIDTITKIISGIEPKNPGDNRQLIKRLQSSITSDQPAQKPAEQIPVVKKPVVETTSAASPENVVLSGANFFAKIRPEAEKVEEKPQAEPFVKEKVPADEIARDENRLQSETVRISTSKLDPLFLQAEQMIQSKIALAQRSAELRQINDFITLWHAASRKTENQHFSSGGWQVKEIISAHNKQLSELENKVAAVALEIENDQRLLGRMIDEHLESMKRILMLPISAAIEGFPKLVRDLARSQDKSVDLNIRGSEIEVDKRILEELKDPLIHLIRNCVDHGLKKTEDRLKINKPASGTITLHFIAVDSRTLEITIADDGIGIQVENVVASAIKAGIISKENADKLTKQESLNLIFKSGLSTSPFITDISGRGLGLAIVREKVEKLGGTVTVESQQNLGTSFRLLLPLTLSTFRGVLVRAGEHLFFIPTINVNRVVRVNANEIRTVENRETINLDGEILAITKLSDTLGLNDKSYLTNAQKNASLSKGHFFQIIVIKHGDKQIGFKVDEILDEHQILVKELGKQLKSVRNISGATVLGSGKVVPVINISDLMKSAVSENGGSMKAIEEKVPEKAIRILVTEDSITSRTLIKDILESAGYIVETAVDGLDGVTKALVGNFDLIVSDVDMPRMNGFELTAKIRKDKKTSEIPVVLVTALESREDKEHGIDVGASAYIVKSSFNQSNLLEVVKKLL